MIFGLSWLSSLVEEIFEMVDRQTDRWTEGCDWLGHHLPNSFNCNIMITHLCNLYPLTSHIYIVKLGYTKVFIFFLFLL